MSGRAARSARMLVRQDALTNHSAMEGVRPSFLTEPLPPSSFSSSGSSSSSTSSQESAHEEPEQQEEFVLPLEEPVLPEEYPEEEEEGVRLYPTSSLELDDPPASLFLPPIYPPNSPVTRSIKRRLDSCSSEDPPFAMPSPPRPKTTGKNASTMLANNNEMSPPRSFPPTPFCANVNQKRRSKKLRRMETQTGEAYDNPENLDADATLPYTYELAAQMGFHPVITEEQTVQEKEEKKVETENMDNQRSSCPQAEQPSSSNSSDGPKTKAKGRHVSFHSVEIFFFEREQGSCSVPDSKGVSLGMKEKHHSSRKIMLNNGKETYYEDEELEEGEDPGDGQPIPGNKYTIRLILPRDARDRRNMLKASGVAIKRREEDLDMIRQSRMSCGCSCRNGQCNPETCECARDGIKCQVDDVTRTPYFPCGCTRDRCGNPSGRVEFDPQRVFYHHRVTLQRLRDIEKMGNTVSVSPKLIRFADEHTSTSYLSTPPPKAYFLKTQGSKQEDKNESNESSPLKNAGKDKKLEEILSCVNGEVFHTPPESAEARQPARFPVTPVFQRFPSKLDSSLSSGEFCSPLAEEESPLEEEEEEIPPETPVKGQMVLPKFGPELPEKPDQRSPMPSPRKFPVFKSLI